MPWGQRRQGISSFGFTETFVMLVLLEVDTFSSVLRTVIEILGDLTGLGQRFKILLGESGARVASLIQFCRNNGFCLIPSDTWSGVHAWLSYEIMILGWGLWNGDWCKLDFGCYLYGHWFKLFAILISLALCLYALPRLSGWWLKGNLLMKHWWSASICKKNKKLDSQFLVSL